MRAAAYMRVSLKTGMTVENQRPIIENWFHTNKADNDTIMFFVEEESTRKTREVQRTVYEQILQGQYDTLICARLDRWGRSVQELTDTVNGMVNVGSRVVFINSGLDIKKEGFDATQRMQFHIISVFAEYERDLIRERTLEGQARAADEGKYPGRPVGSKDKHPRVKSGYYQRWVKKRQIDREAKARAKSSK